MVGQKRTCIYMRREEKFIADSSWLIAENQKLFAKMQEELMPDCIQK